MDPGPQNDLTGGGRFDPSGFILEHYVDGDLLDMTHPTQHTKAAPDNLHVWGEQVPINKNFEQDTDG